MYLSHYAFDGDPTELRAGYDALRAQFSDEIDLRIVVERPDGLDVYDSCPSEADFRGFSTSAGFRDALAAVGLPIPRVDGLGTIVVLHLPRTATVR